MWRCEVYPRSSAGSLPARILAYRGTVSGKDGIEWIALSFGLSIAVVPLSGLALNYTPCRSRLGVCASRAVSVHGLASVIAGVRRAGVSEAERFVVEGWGLGRGGEGGDGGRGRSDSGGEGEGRGGGLA